MDSVLWKNASSAQHHRDLPGQEHLCPAGHHREHHPSRGELEGHLTLEFGNSSGADCRIYAEEGICQLLFFEGDPCETTYSDRKGKYQHQPERVTLARV